MESVCHLRDLECYLGPCCLLRELLYSYRAKDLSVLIEF
jgi:hypothetical protein